MAGEALTEPPPEPWLSAERECFWSEYTTCQAEARASGGQSVSASSAFDSRRSRPSLWSEGASSPRGVVAAEDSAPSFASVSWDERDKAAELGIPASEECQQVDEDGECVYREGPPLGKAPPPQGFCEALGSAVGFIGELGREVIRNGVAYVLSNAKEILIAGVIITLLLLSALCVLLATCVTTYYVVSFYTSSPPIHSFPVYFDYCPSVSQEIRHQIKNVLPPETCRRSASDPSAGGFCSLDRPFREALSWRSSTAPSTRDAVLAAPSELCVGSAAVATVPFSNRTWEFSPTDEEMFAFRPDVLSHFASRNAFWEGPASEAPRQEKDEENGRLGGGRRRFSETADVWGGELGDGASRLPHHSLADIRLFVSTAFGEKSLVQTPPPPGDSPPMATLLLHDRSNSLVASSVRALELRRSLSGVLLQALFPHSLLRLWGWPRSEQSLVLMEDVPLALLRRLRFARLVLFPKVALLRAELSFVPKPQGMHGFLVHHPTPAYFFLAAVALLCVWAAVLSCCCFGVCCCMCTCVLPSLQAAKLPFALARGLAVRLRLCAVFAEQLLLGGKTESWEEKKEEAPASPPPPSSERPRNGSFRRSSGADSDGFASKQKVQPLLA